MFLELNNGVMFVSLKDLTSIELVSLSREIRYFTSENNAATFIETFESPEKADERYRKLRKELHDKRLLIAY